MAHLSQHELFIYWKSESKNWNRSWKYGNAAAVRWIHPLHEKLAAIEKLVPEFGVHAPCRVLGVLRSTYYHHAMRRPEQTVIEKEDEIFRPIIQQIFEETQGRIGAKKIRAIMMTQGYTISPERISRLMKEMGLVCISTMKGTHDNFTPKGIYRHNRLKQDFHQEHPNKVWVSDITMLYVNYERFTSVSSSIYFLERSSHIKLITIKKPRL